MLSDQLQLDQKLIIREPIADDDADYARLLSLLMAAPYDVPLLRERRERWKQKYWFVRVAELDGKVVGILELNDAGSKQTAMARVVVEADLRGRGIGTSLLRTIEDNPVYTDRKVFAQCRDNDLRSLQFMKNLGMTQDAHVFESWINPQEFSLEPFQPYIDAVLDSGLRISNLAELGDTEENRYRMWEIEHVTDFDIPGLDPDQLTSWEDAKQSWFTASWYNPAGEIVVLDGDTWVGSSACAELSPGVCWYVQRTCVLKEYRGRGIATAVKALATQYAKDRGATVLRANNHSTNFPMLAISKKFNFQPEPGWFECSRRPLGDKDAS